MNYIKSEIIFVNYVREQREADIHLIITQQITASGGKEYVLQFIGQGKYADLNYTLKQTVSANATEDEIRKTITETIKRGLMPYLARTNLSEMCTIDFSPPSGQTQIIDKWHNWIFSLSLVGYGTGEQAYSYIYYNLYPTIQRIAENEKFKLEATITNTQRKFIEDTTTYIAKSHSYSAEAFWAQKTSNHFSVGGQVFYLTSKYSNIRYGFSIAPKFEYNFVPYSEYVHHKICVQFQPMVLHRSYYDTTLYNLLSENRLQNQLVLTTELTRQWSSVGFIINGSHYWHDFSKNRLTIEGSINMRVFAGLSMSIAGGYSFIHDQLSLRKAGANEQERLLRLRELATGYNYWTTFSITYSLGSSYSNIVNPIFLKIFVIK